MRCRAICLTICSLLWATSSEALTICGKLQQGGIAHIKDEGLLSVKIEDKIYKADADGEALLAFHRDAKSEQMLELTYADGLIVNKKLPIIAVEWDVQKVDGLPAKTVSPSKEDLAEIEKERRDVLAGLSFFGAGSAWKSNMLKPVEGRTSGVFGGQRIMNGVKKNPHQGWDIASPKGTDVKAAAEGVVTMSGGPYFYSGNMVLIEHGQNLTTIYAHLDKTLVKKGDKVKKGQVIGQVGTTGRSTGPHLHWGVSLNGVRIDGQNLLDFYNNNCVVLKD